MSGTEAVVGQMVGDRRCIKASKDAVFSLIPNGESVSLVSTCIVSVVPEMMIKSSEPGVYFCLAGGDSDAPIRATMPLLGKFGAIDNVIFLAARETPIGTYLLGVPVDTLLNWTPPTQASQTIEEDKFLWSAKMPHEDLQELAEVENTATHPQLLATVDKFISHCPTFKMAGIKSITQLRARSGLGYEKSITKAVTLGEQLDRKSADKKGKASKDQKESEGGGADAKTKWAELKTVLLETHVGNFNLTFDQRYLKLPIDPEATKLTVEGLAQLQPHIECASPTASLPSVPQFTSPFTGFT